MSESSIPSGPDYSLGGQIVPQTESGIPGGIENLQQQIKNATPELRSQLLSSTLQYGDAGIELLLSTLSNDDSLTVRANAYRQLQQAIAESAESCLKPQMEMAITQGIPLKQGDILYGVHEIPIEYDDENYLIYDFFMPEDATSGDYLDVIEKTPPSEINWDNMDPEEIAYGSPILISYHVFRESAQEIAELQHQGRILDSETPDLFEFAWFRDHSFDVNHWCITHDLPTLSEDWWDAGPELVQYLKDRQEVALLSQLWKETTGSLVVEHEQVISRSCYLKITRPFSVWKSSL